MISLFVTNKKRSKEEKSDRYKLFAGILKEIASIVEENGERWVQLK
jgi:hypothetical protein